MSWFDKKMTLRIGGENKTYSTNRINKEANRKAGGEIKLGGFLGLIKKLGGANNSWVQNKIKEIGELHAALHAPDQSKEPDVIDSLLIFNNIQKLAKEVITHHNKNNPSDEKPDPAIKVTNDGNNRYALKIDDYTMVHIIPKLGLQQEILNKISKNFPNEESGGRELFAASLTSDKSRQPMLSLIQSALESIWDSNSTRLMDKPKKRDLKNLLAAFHLHYMLSCVKEQDFSHIHDFDDLEAALATESKSNSSNLNNSNNDSLKDLKTKFYTKISDNPIIYAQDESTSKELKEAILKYCNINPSNPPTTQKNGGEDPQPILQHMKRQALRWRDTNFNPDNGKRERKDGPHFTKNKNSGALGSSSLS